MRAETFTSGADGCSNILLVNCWVEAETEGLVFEQGSRVPQLLFECTHYNLGPSPVHLCDSRTAEWRTSEISSNRSCINFVMEQNQRIALWCHRWFSFRLKQRSWSGSDLKKINWRCTTQTDRSTFTVGVVYEKKKKKREVYSWLCFLFSVNSGVRVTAPVQACTNRLLNHGCSHHWILVSVCLNASYSALFSWSASHCMYSDISWFSALWWTH